ncbi:MAG: HIT domain-containing protein [Rickettsia sp.]|nr:HIT domain-containing protein [Rickettsia sp.]
MQKIYSEENIFYQIISGKINSEKLYEDDFLICIKDIAPVAPVHILVIPKKKFLDFNDFITKAPPELIIKYYQIIPEMAKNHNISDYRVLTNIGNLAGQTVMHFHTHIIGGKKLGGLIGI